MSIKWWMDKEVVVYIYNGIPLGNEKEWNMDFCCNVDGTGECYAKWNKSYRERQIPYISTRMWILGNVTEDHGGGEGGKKLQRGKEANHKRLLKTEYRGTWVAQSVKWPTSAQVMISRSVSSSPTLGSVLTARSLEPVSDSVSPSLWPSPVHTLSLSVSKINKR